MTLPPERLGNKGQGYLVEANGWPEKGWNTIGWTTTMRGAQHMADAIAKAPSCSETRVVDRAS